MEDVEKEGEDEASNGVKEGTNGSSFASLGNVTHPAVSATDANIPFSSPPSPPTADAADGIGTPQLLDLKQSVCEIKAVPLPSEILKGAESTLHNAWDRAANGLGCTTAKFITKAEANQEDKWPMCCISGMRHCNPLSPIPLTDDIPMDVFEGADNMNLHTSMDTAILLEDITDDLLVAKSSEQGERVVLAAGDLPPESSELSLFSSQVEDEDFTKESSTHSSRKRMASGSSEYTLVPLAVENAHKRLKSFSASSSSSSSIPSEVEREYMLSETESDIFSEFADSQHLIKAYNIINRRLQLKRDILKRYIILIRKENQALKEKFSRDSSLNQRQKDRRLRRYTPRRSPSPNVCVKSMERCLQTDFGVTILGLPSWWEKEEIYQFLRDNQCRVLYKAISRGRELTDRPVRVFYKSQEEAEDAVIAISKIRSSKYRIEAFWGPSNASHVPSEKRIDSVSEPSKSQSRLSELGEKEAMKGHPSKAMKVHQKGECIPCFRLLNGIECFDRSTCKFCHHADHDPMFNKAAKLERPLDDDGGVSLTVVSDDKSVDIEAEAKASVAEKGCDVSLKGILPPSFDSYEEQQKYALERHKKGWCHPCKLFFAQNAVCKSALKNESCLGCHHEDHRASMPAIISVPSKPKSGNPKWREGSKTVKEAPQPFLAASARGRTILGPLRDASTVNGRGEFAADAASSPQAIWAAQTLSVLWKDPSAAQTIRTPSLPAKQSSLYPVSSEFIPTVALSSPIQSPMPGTLHRPTLLKPQASRSTQEALETTQTPFATTPPSVAYPTEPLGLYKTCLLKPQRTQQARFLQQRTPMAPPPETDPEGAYFNGVKDTLWKVHGDRHAVSFPTPPAGKPQTLFNKPVTPPQALGGKVTYYPTNRRQPFPRPPNRLLATAPHASSPYKDTRKLQRSIFPSKASPHEAVFTHRMVPLHPRQPSIAPIQRRLPPNRLPPNLRWQPYK